MEEAEQEKVLQQASSLKLRLQPAIPLLNSRKPLRNKCNMPLSSATKNFVLVGDTIPISSPHGGSWKGEGISSISLDLSNAGLTFTPTEVFEHQPQLTWLSLARNSIRSLPDELGERLLQLRGLHLHGNKLGLRGVPFDAGTRTNKYKSNRRPTSTQSLVAPKEAQPQYDSLGNPPPILPPSLSRLVHLEVLDLSNNHLRIFPAVICSLSALVCLDVSQNILTELPSSLCYCTSLRKLNVIGNPLPNATMRALHLGLHILYTELANKGNKR